MSWGAVLGSESTPPPHCAPGLKVSGKGIGLPGDGHSPGSSQLLTPSWGQDPNTAPQRPFLSGMWPGN